MATATQSTNATMSDKEITNDLLMTEKHTAATLNTFITESSCPNLSQNLKTILNDVYQIHTEIFDTMNQRGWYPVKDAMPNDVQQTKDTFNAMQV